MASFERRRFQRSIAVGLALTLIACAVDHLGWLSTLDDWFSDVRAARCQFFASKPDERIVHVDIDDASLEPGAVGRWPWSRGTLARIITEIGRAKPAAVALDLHLIDPEVSNQDGDSATTNPTAVSADDAALAESLAALKNAVVAVTFETLAADTRTREQVIAQEVLTANLEQTDTEFIREVRKRGVKIEGRDELQDLFLHAQKLAMHDRVIAELQDGGLTDDQLRDRLLPHLRPGIKMPVLALLKREAAACRERQEFRRFGLQVPPLPIPAVAGEFSKVPLNVFAQGATYSGFVNYDYFNSSALRMLPMMVEAEHRLYPQFGLVLACAILGTDVRDLRVEADQIVIPVPHGTEVRIPTHSFHSNSLNRDFASIADIRWFGTGNWRTMYDWPNHRSPRRHISANAFWDICKTADKIKRNDSDIDDYIQILLGEGEGDRGLDNTYATKYAAALPPIDDYSSREKAAKFALNSLEDSHLIEDLKSIPTAERLPEESARLDHAIKARDALTTLLQDTPELIAQLASQRSSVANRLSGKGVLLGWTAEGFMDVVNTSIIIRCPGVVVHGLIAESILSGRFPRRAPWGVGLGFVLLLGFATSIFVARLPPLRGVLATLLLMASYLLLNGIFFFDFGSWIVPVAGPVVAISVVWSGITLQRVIFESIERNRVATEVAIISREMDLAHRVQAALIPKEPPKIPGLEADGWTLPADKTGGDCYDLWPLTDGRLAILIADASGHGLAPAMIVSQVRTLLRALSELDSRPSDLLKRVNARLAEDLEPGRFITVFLGFLSPGGLLEYASAGHGPQFLYGCDGGELQQLESTGAPLGCDTVWLCDDPTPPIQMAEGGTLAVFSDGIFEAMNPSAELFGIDRLKEILHANRGQPGREIIKLLKDAVLKWQQKPVPGDDQTIVIARRIAVASGK